MLYSRFVCIPTRERGNEKKEKKAPSPGPFKGGNMPRRLFRDVMEGLEWLNRALMQCDFFHPERYCNYHWPC